MKFQSSTLSQNSFHEMNLAPVLLNALEQMSIKKPTPIQSKAIPAVIAGSDLIGIAQTGSGKTLAYALSVLTGLEQKPTARALILAPSREMAQQIYKVFLDLCREMPVSVCLAIGGSTGSKQANQLKKNPKIIIATPGRMNDHLQSNKLLLKDVEYVVIDEADRMLDMGFAPQLKSIQQTLRGQRQTLMFSASFGHNVDQIAQLFLHPKAVMIRSEQAESPVDSLKQKVVLLDRTMKNDRLLDELNATRGGVIVFTGSQESCEAVGEYLQSYGFASDLIHGGLSQGQRNRVVREFREGDIRIMVATDLLARGLDVPHVDHVVNFDLPFQAEDFLHRIGRTARAGRSGEAITFVTPSDHRMYNKVKGYLQGAKEEKMDPTFKFIDRSKKFAKRSDEKSGPKRSGKGAPPSKKGTGKSSVNPFKKRR
ncbi:DEAD/DEAH box helicase [Bdellovibrio sp. HCB288]|uniref:DEAD/DEAH box helicase n=1 Tax=Bdellovibrio sp. HCB288 TaxID=3394355 RepID=UPI0039B62EA6